MQSWMLFSTAKMKELIFFFVYVWIFFFLCNDLSCKNGDLAKCCRKDLW